MEEETKEKVQTKKSLLKNPILLVAILLLVAGGGYAAVTTGLIDVARFSNSTPEKEFVALVNGQGLEKRLFDARLTQAKSNYEAQGISLQEETTAQLREQVLNGMIEEQLLIQYGNRQGLIETEEMLEEEYQRILSQFGNEEEFKKQLTLQNVTLEDVKTQISEQAIIGKIIDEQSAQNNVEVSEEEIQQAYDGVAESGAEVPPFEEVKAEIELQLQNQKIGQFMSVFLEQLRAEGTIEILI